MQENGYIGNTNALKFKNEEELKKAIDNYFLKCDENQKPYTMTGLALSLGIDRRTLARYGDRDLFAPLIKNARNKVEEMLEESLYRLGNNSGVIFNLKNNYGWKDTTEEKQEIRNGVLDDLMEALNNAKKD